VQLQDLFPPLRQLCIFLTSSLSPLSSLPALHFLSSRLCVTAFAFEMPAPHFQEKGDTSLDAKELPAQYDIDDDAEVVDDVSGLLINGYTKRDQKDMNRMGKKQELMRNFRRLSAFSFTVMLTATWEYLLMYAN
jgi:hypothetical protein